MGAPPKVVLASPAYVVIRWALDLRDLLEDADPNLRDVVREPAYALGGMAVPLMLAGITLGRIPVPLPF